MSTASPGSPEIPEIPDISQLDNSQQQSLQTYISITDQDPAAAIPILQRAEWNVQIAVTRFFEGESSTSTNPIAEVDPAPPSTSYRHTSNLQLDDLVASPRPRSTVRRNPNSVGRISTQPSHVTQYDSPLILSILFSPFSVLYRVFVLLLSPIGYLFPFIPRFFGRLFPSRTRQPNRRPLPPADNARRFIREFSEEYGAHELPFVESGFNLALDRAKKDLKFLLVILLSPSHDDTSPWVQETLLSGRLISFMRSHRDEIILWGGNVQDAEAYQVSDTMQCTKFPFAGLICRTSDSGSPDMSTVMRAIGPMASSELVAKLGTAMTGQRNQLAAARAERQHTQASRNLRQEQDSAYQRSLAQDRERTRVKREEGEAQARLEKAAREKGEAQERHAHALQQWRRWRAQTLPSEPDKNAEDAVRLSIRLTTGERVIRSFRGDGSVEEVYAYVECHDVLTQHPDAMTEKALLPPDDEEFQHSYTFRLVSPMPRTVYDVADGGSIGQQIGKGANLIVEPIHDEDDSPDDLDEDIDDDARPVDQI